MKFPRNSRLLRSPSDVAPFAAVFFLLVIFLILGALLPTPGIPLELPAATSLPGTDQPSVSIALDQSGRYFFADQILAREQVGERLRAVASNSPAPLTLIIHADQSVTCQQLVQLTLMARAAGITNSLLATLPGPGAQDAPRP